eukprot:2225312-Amphidinium_carterae.1
MRASSLVPTAKPEIINLRKALAVDHDRTQLKNVRNVQPGLLRGQSMWNFEIRDHHQGRSDGKVSHVLSTRTYIGAISWECRQQRKSKSNTFALLPPETSLVLPATNTRWYT